ncbi:hypothetical protein [Amycolatopsis aidingensis]|uniref:hypothetical protein n=1 Tax=Amycolatopsis aidingensis TaxID=2842453 RepID=UPI001C0D96E8|nr:hypothetical protein [Amycolatopsis aidingensis]
MQPDQVDHLLEQFEQRLVRADTATDHNTAVVVAAQRRDDRVLRILVKCDQTVVGLEIVLDEPGLTTGDRRLDRLGVSALG